MSATGPKLSSLKYMVEGVLDSEGEGTVVRIGDQSDLGKPYALKFIKRESAEDDAELDRAQAAVEASAKLGHPVALRYHDFRLKKKFLIIPDRGELLMEFVDGRSLDKLGTLEVGPATLVFRQLAAVLNHMHRRGVLHGDIKPSLVMLSNGGQVKTLGYGLNLLKNRGVKRGTTQYMAPEQMKGNVVDEKTDLYNLGATMYQLLTGRSANVGNRAMGEAGKIPIPTALNPKISSKLNNLIVACLQSNPHKRPEGAFNVEQELTALVQEMGLDESSLRGLARVREREG